MNALALKNIHNSMYSILYIDADTSLHTHVQQLLSPLCHSVIASSNTQEAIKLLYTHTPHIIIIDTRLPDTNGISFLQTIREENPNLLLIVYSKSVDKEDLCELIHLGISYFIDKTSTDDLLIKYVGSLLKEIKAKQEHEKNLQKRINKASTTMLASMVQIYPLPTVIYTVDGNVKFINALAAELFNLSLDEDENQSYVIQSKIVSKEGFVSNILSIRENTFTQNRVMIKTQIAKKIYLVSKRAILSEEFGQLFLFAFVDITRMEYEKQKSQNYSLYLREQIYYGKMDKTPQTEQQKTEYGNIQTSTKDLIQKSSIPPSYDHIRLAGMHSRHKLSAREYSLEIGDDILEELGEMDELEQDMHDTIVSIENDFSLEVINHLAYNFRRYAKTVSRLVEFEDLAFSLHKLSEFLMSLQYAHLNAKKMHLLLDGICSDLIQWRKMVFITKEVQDIHYFDASLLSSCLQIEVEFGDTNPLHEDELDLF